MTTQAYINARAIASRLIPQYVNPTSITHERKTSTPDGAGGTTTTWSTVQTFIGPVLPATGREQQTAMALEYRLTHKIYAEYDDALDVRAEDRFVFDWRVMAVKQVVNIAEADAAWKFMVEEGAPS